MTARDIIAVGASLGGLDALSTLLGGLNASLLIVLHSSPREQAEEDGDHVGGLPTTKSKSGRNHQKAPRP